MKNLWLMLIGAASILDGIIIILSFGYMLSSLRFQSSLAYARWQSKRQAW